MWALTTRLALAISAFVLVAGIAQAEPIARFDATGKLMLPEGYREWVFLGTTVTPNDMNFGSAYSPGIKNTYLDRESFAHWKKTGTFRGGAMIVQERLATEADKFMNANGYFPGKYLGLQAMVKDSERFPESVWGFFSFGGPPYAEAVSAVPGMSELDCAGCHTRADDDWVFTRFYPTLTAAAPPQKSEGQELFERDWTPATATAARDTTRDDMGDGLGPLFNARSCKACHAGGGRGVFKVRADGVIEGDGLLLKAGVNDDGDPIYGGQIQPHALPGFRPEGIPAVHYEKITDPSGAILRKPVFELRDPAYGALDPASRLAGRVAQAIFGNGSLEKVSVATLSRLADPDDADGDGISGRINRIKLSMGGTAVGRFGWKAGQWSLLVQSAKAFRMDLGLSSPLMGPAWGDCTPVQTECHMAANGERAARDGREVGRKTLKLVTAHVAGMAALTPRGSNRAGEKLFTTVGCAACHAPSLPLTDGGAVGAYTDLLLHDMGDGLADGIEEGSASGSEWRTAPLMGLGRLMEKRLPLLHDGRARDVGEAILWHGGEAERVANAYRNLSEGQRLSLRHFLETL